MPLDFRSRDEEGFSVKRFLKTVGAGVAVFLIFMAVGYYGLGPRITVTEEGRIQLRMTRAPADAAQPQAAAPEPKPMPKVAVQEKLPPDVTAGTGIIIGSREVAPFDYERYQQKRRERKPKSIAPADEPPADPPAPIEDEYFVPDETPEPPASEPSAARAARADAHRAEPASRACRAPTHRDRTARECPVPRAGGRLREPRKREPSRAEPRCQWVRREHRTVPARRQDALSRAGVGDARSRQSRGAQEPAGEQRLPSGRGKSTVAAYFSAKCSRTIVRSFVSACFSNWRMRSREGRLT
jgi:hypothetical protein